MAYVTPNSTVQYFKDIGLSPNYSDTLYFASVSAKDSYFDSLSKIGSESALSYVAKDNKLRSSLPMATLVNAGYLRFKNTSFENKWFYAFITSVDYANNGMAEVTFQLDPIMTYMGNFTLGQCFVEREHTVTDNLFEHTLDEGLETGNKFLYDSDVGYICKWTDWYPVAICSFTYSDGEFGNATGFEIGEYASGLQYYVFSKIEDFNEWIGKVVDGNKADGVISIFMAPAELTIKSLTDREIFTNSVEKTAKTDNIDGYTPKNKKLFCYPYNFCTMTDRNGRSIDLRYELFDSTSLTFVTKGVVTGTPGYFTYPKNYNGVTNCYDYAVDSEPFPQVSWSIDTYRAYLAQWNAYGGTEGVLWNVAQTGAGSFGSLAGAALTGNLGGVASAIASPISALANVESLIRRQEGISTEPGKARGSSSGSVQQAMGEVGTCLYYRYITAEYAKIIDDYFTSYGYAVKRVKSPSMKNRPYWTYLKTVGCNVHGNLPASDARTIESIINNGCRFWNASSGVTIGDFSLDNSPS